jgi:hypothetical protein
VGKPSRAVHSGTNLFQERLPRDSGVVPAELPRSIEQWKAERPSEIVLRSFAKPAIDVARIVKKLAFRAGLDPAALPSGRTCD